MKNILVAVALALALAGCAMPLPSNTLGPPSYTTPTTTYAPLPTAASFRLQIVETERKCWGSGVGCNVTYRVVPTWMGSGSAPTSSFTLLYTVVGLQESTTGNIAVTNGKFATESGYGIVDEGQGLTAQVTQVLEN